MNDVYYDRIDPVSGRRFRDLGGGCIEFQPDIILAHGKPEQKAEEKQPLPRRRCPFKSIVSADCVFEQCAFFVGSACVLSQIGKRQPERGTEGLRCPINKEARPCSADCALYRGGCTLTTII